MKSVTWQGCKKREFDENEGEGKEKMKRFENLPFWELAAPCRSRSFPDSAFGSPAFRREISEPAFDCKCLARKREFRRKCGGSKAEMGRLGAEEFGDFKKGEFGCSGIGAFRSLATAIEFGAPA